MSTLVSLYQVRLIVLKDLSIELRSRQALLTTAFFALVILVIFKFSFDPGEPAIDAAVPGILWVSLLFPGLVQLNRSFQLEEEEETVIGLLLSPLDSGSLYLAKLLSNWFFLLMVDLFILGAFILLFNPSLSWNLFWILVVLATVTWAFSAIGTLFAAMLSRLHSRDVLLPVLLFPIMIPVLIGAVSATRDVLGSGGGEPLFFWLRLLLGCDVIFAAAGWLVFDYVVRE